MKNYFFVILLIISIITSCYRRSKSNNDSVKEVMDDIVTRLYQTLSSEQLDTIGSSYILNNITGKEKLVLATKYWYFNVNIPVTVSLMRDMDQENAPFWLKTIGFKKTEMVVRNMYYSYEVWQKDFNAGLVELGINGFDKHRPVYFISVGPQDPANRLEITNVFPEDQYLDTMKIGAFTYHDWDELILEEVPDKLIGQVLFTTIRGRAREAHLTGAFRTTPYPSGVKPDQIMLTWSGNPAASIDIQWRTNTSILVSKVKYWLNGTYDTLISVANLKLMEDRLLQNDRYVNRFTAHLNHLQSGASYSYQVGSEYGTWSDIASFNTEADSNDRFSFIWFGDTHHSPKFGELINAAEKSHPEVAFYSIAGDIVSDGLHRDQWDDLFDFTKDVICRKPLMVVPGNHDNRAGLGALMYRELFSYPQNGPQGVEKEQTYSFMYNNALFLMIDATSPIDTQSSWIEEQLSRSDATWKFAMFHFPPYSDEGGYPDIRNKWCTLFDKYHVDMVMSGHVHYYLRTKPINKEKSVGSPAEGTIYLISIGIPDNDQIDKLPFADAQVSGEMLYQALDINGNKLVYKAMNIEGVVRDEMTITK